MAYDKPGSTDRPDKPVTPKEVSCGTQCLVRYSQSTYVGEVSKDIVIEGNVDDVLKILGDTPTTIRLSIAPNINKDELGNAIKKAIEQAFSEEPQLL